MQSNKRKTLLLVEGKSAEVKLFSKILDCFPEINVNKQDILVYGTNLWTLYHALEKEFGSTWYEGEIDFIEFLKSSPVILEQIEGFQLHPESLSDFSRNQFRDIFLVFDYERQDPHFDASRIRNMLGFWSESTENGLLYINYPMIEAYKHLKKPLPDLGYLSKKCVCSELFSDETKQNKYKNIVGSESSFTDLRKYTRELFRDFVIHNLCKASVMTKGTTDISAETAQQFWQRLSLEEILEVQNQCSQDAVNGFVHVLATCLFFIPEYHSKLIFDT
ncbi:MAG: hypothetical protein IK134_12890 [Oscillospiraceae bacterium]|nr:hypothetical protein [Oscillospiraceae bacterium]